ncbi:MAG: hypothetical protein EBE86_035265, partial [Hormoscilla sp. GUM202]|nr:hypothetical protein [Hormoscilla sp. GUM202]
YVAKFDRNGDLVKALNIGGSSRDYGRGIATDSNSNVWTTGLFEGNIDIDGDGNNDLTSNGTFDSYVAKFDSNGDLVKALNIGGSSSDYGRGIATDSNGNAWATGLFNGSIDIDGDGNNDLTSNGLSDSYVFKFSDPTNLNNIDENVAANTVVGTFSTTDPDTGDTFTYQLVAGTGDTDNAAFTILGDQLQINSSPDFETQSSYSIRVRTEDADGQSYSNNFIININDVNEDPTDLNLSNNSINENLAVNIVNISGSSDDWGRGIATDSNGNVWATGSFSGSIDIDGDGNIDLTSNGDDDVDVYVAKFDPGGNLLKALNIGSSSNDWGLGIATDSNDNVWTTGSFSGNIDIDGDGNIDLTSNGDDDGYVAKFDRNGTLVKALNIGGSNWDRSNGIATDSNGNAWVIGQFQGNIDIDGDGNIDFANNGTTQQYVAKFDRNGTLVKAFEISFQEHFNDIATDSNGNAWAIGYSHIYDRISTQVVQFNSNGTLVKALSFDGSLDRGYGIAIDSNGNVWVTGSFKGNIDIDRDGNNDLTSEWPSTDSYVAKFDRNGTLVKALKIGGSSNDYGDGIAIDSNGNAWAIGEFQGNIDIDGDGNNDLTSNGGTDSYLAKFDSDGHLLEALNIGSRSNDYGNGIATDSNGNVWATGEFQGNIDIDGDGNIDLINNSGNDSYVVKFPETIVGIVGTFSTTDPDTEDTSFTYQLVPGTGDTDNADFTIDGNQLRIYSSPDFETQSSYSIRVRTEDASGQSYEDNFIISINDVNEAPTDLNLSNNSINENVLAIVGTFSTTDPDTGDTFTYQLVAGMGD